MIQAEKPDFIVFTGTLPSALSYFFFYFWFQIYVIGSDSFCLCMILFWNLEKTRLLICLP
jgi:hypothetical protein